MQDMSPSSPYLSCSKPSNEKALSLLLIYETLFFILKFADTLEQKATNLLPGEMDAIWKDLEEFSFRAFKGKVFEKETLFQTLSFHLKNLLETPKLESQELLSVLDELSLLFFSLKKESAPCLFKKEAETFALLLKEYFGKLKKQVSFLFQGLVPFLKELKASESLFVYLIEKKDFFNFHLGEKTIEALLKSLFPKGLDELKTLIYEGYSRRGFSHIYEKQKYLFDNLEWEVTCPHLTLSH